MAKLHLRRFSTFENYQNAILEEGTFFIIIESGQLGVRSGEVDILTPTNYLKGYQLPEEDSVVTENDTIIQAIAKLDKRYSVCNDNAAEALSNSNNALESIRNLEYTGDANPDHEVRITTLENKIELISEEDFDTMEGFDKNKIYYVYEND